MDTQNYGLNNSKISFWGVVLLEKNHQQLGIPKKAPVALSVHFPCARLRNDQLNDVSPYVPGMGWSVGP